uniref:Uncharacterized protein n=1 Tax=Apteryx owenii TaxID=8824 RepID=A0A8B9PHD9_APTOW
MQCPRAWVPFSCPPPSLCVGQGGPWGRTTPRRYLRQFGYLQKPLERPNDDFSAAEIAEATRCERPPAPGRPEGD